MRKRTKVVHGTSLRRQQKTELTWFEYRGIAKRVFRNLLDSMAGGVPIMGLKNLWGDPKDIHPEIQYPRVEWANSIFAELQVILSRRLERDHLLLGYNIELRIESRGSQDEWARATILVVYSPERPQSDQRSFDGAEDS